MDKKDYILAQFRRTWNKKYENYCIERIYNKLDNLNIEFSTQQMFRRNDGKIALVDLYFPQLVIGIEIDEEYHKSQEEADKERENDIYERIKQLETVLLVEPKILRIDAGNTQTIESINKRIEEVVKTLNGRIDEIGRDTLKWEIKSLEDYKEKAIICSKENVSLHTVWEVSELFNKGYKKGMQKCFFSVGKKDKCEYVWCPKLKIEGYNIDVPFNNEITPNGNTIYESTYIDNDKFVEDVLGTNQRRYVFPRYKTQSGEFAYVFNGVYELDEEETIRLNKRVWKKVEEELNLNKICSY